MSAQTTFIGGLTEAPTLRFTSSGKAVASFNLAHTPRRLNKTTQEWEDAGEPLYMRCNAWEKLAENLAESGLDKGDRLIVIGTLQARTWEKDGQKRTSVELRVDEMGPTIKNATVKVTKAGRGGSTDGGGQSDDPWGSGPQSGGFAGGNDSEAPF